MHVDRFLDQHERHFGSRPTALVRAPGRVNLIGEHIDYHFGPVLPLAVDRAVVATAAPASGRTLSVYSRALGSAVELPADSAAPLPARHWSAYVEGMRVLLEREGGIRVPGGSLLITGNLDPGCGMSSSAALCVATGLALLHLAGRVLPPLDLVEFAQQTEHEFAGTPCGLMDPYVCCLGTAGHALLIDCHEKRHTLVPLALGEYRLVAFPSGVRHALADGAYEDRRRAGQTALLALQKQFPELVNLSRATIGQLQQLRDDLPDPAYRRARHVVTETARVAAAVAALHHQDVPHLGRLLQASQSSLRDDYEVSCPEIDDLTGLLDAVPGVVGARMIGGGFGGIVLAIVHESAIEAALAGVRQAFYEPRGLNDTPFIVQPSDGARVIEL